MIEVKRLSKQATIPTRGTADAAGWDFYCLESMDIPPGRQAILPTGIAMAIPPGWYGRMAPRSSLAAKYAIDVHAGVVDADYRGEIKVALVNHGDATVEFRKGDRIAQLIIERCSQDSLVEVDELSETPRGNGGFGSTGK